MNQVYNWNDLRRYRAMSLEDKIKRSNEIIQKALGNSKRPAIACSWGKDSVVVVHLVRSFKPDALVLFQNTGVEFPETFAYRDLLLKEWNITNYTETKPIKTFWECVKEFGYPKFRRMKGGKGAPKCCLYLKEQPGINALHEFMIDTEFVGLQASESMVRRLSFFREGDSYYSNRYGVNLVRPIMFWTDKDIWAYHEKFKIPHNPLYDKMARNGCMPCTAFKEWRKVLQKSNPGLYEHVMKQMGEGTLTKYMRDEKEDSAMVEE